MAALRSAGQARSLTFLNAILLTTVMTVPAFGAVETIVVTAERKAEDIQTVPIAVTALTGQDLKSKQVATFKDLQFHVPSVTFTKTQFGNAQFQIRGITTAYGLGAAIAQNLDDVYLEFPQLVTGQYYDIDRVEVLRGPQSTSYGRAATGGTVNVHTTKPDLEAFDARASVDYGSYDTMTPDAMVNLPIIDGELGVRIAVHGAFHHGYERNVYAGPLIYGPVDKNVNSLGAIAGRGSLRWEPTPDTTIDLVADVQHENDSHTRGDAQLCHADPAGILGCLPDKLAFQDFNLNGNPSNGELSREGLAALINTVVGLPYPTAAFVGGGVGVYSLGGNGSSGDPAGPGGVLFNLPTTLGKAVFLDPLSSPAEVGGLGSGFLRTEPANLLTVDTPFTPVFKNFAGTYVVNWQQKISDWLSSTLDFGYNVDQQFTQQSFWQGNPPNNSLLYSHAVAHFNAFFGATNPADVAVYDAAYFNIPGALPLSDPHYNGTFGSYAGLIAANAGGIRVKTPFSASFDEDAFGEQELTGELRFQTNFDGPLNFSAGAFLMNFTNHNQYWVVFPGGDYGAIVVGALTSQGAVLAGAPDPGALVQGLGPFDGEYRKDNRQTRSAFLEATYDILPDLRFIVGGRYNDDREQALVSSCGACTQTLGPFPVNTPSSVVTAAYNATLIPDPKSFNGRNHTITDLWTGRANLTWTPKLDWTDQTTVYTTLSRGELSGGTNTINIQTSPFAPVNFKPATVDAVEIGTKNTLLDGTLTANLSAWYYNYENYQVTIIANRSSVNVNIPARLWGLEDEMVWQPTEALAINFNLSVTETHAGTAYLVDQRNPTGNLPGSIMVKDLINGILCVIQPTTLAAVGHTPGESSLAFHENNFFLPNGGNASIDAPFGVPLVNYGVCDPNAKNPSLKSIANPTGSIAVDLASKGFAYAQEVNINTGLPDGHFTGTGIVSSRGIAGRSLHGNNLPLTPYGQVGIGAQYTIKAENGYTVVPRIDYYWQSHMESRVWNDPVIDRINAWDQMNAQVMLNSPEANWYFKVFVTNIFDKRNPEAQWLTDQAASLFTNEFVEDPRVVGISFGTHW